MNVRKWLRATLALGLAVAVAFAAPATADPPSRVPGGPCLESEQQVQLSSLPSYEEVVRILESIEASSQGEVEVASAGLSGEGRELLYATVGDGPDVFWLQARIHGNELHSTEAVLQVLKYLASSGSPEAEADSGAAHRDRDPDVQPGRATANIRQSTTPVPARPEPGLGALPPARVEGFLRALGGDETAAGPRPPPHGSEPRRGGHEPAEHVPDRGALDRPEPHDGRAVADEPPDGPDLDGRGVAAGNGQRRPLSADRHHERASSAAC